MNNFGKLLSKFLTDYIMNECGGSNNTQKSYAITFRLLLNFFKVKYNIKISKLDFDDFSKERILEFLNYLESDRENCVETRNNRLAAIKSFFHYVQINDVRYINLSNDILSIKKKKSHRKIVSYFHEDEWEIFIKYVYKNYDFDIYVLFVALYETAARISELLNVKLIDLNLGEHSTVKLIGKGNKARPTPIDKNTTTIINMYLENDYNDYGEHYLFYSSHGKKYHRTTINKKINTIILKLKKLYPAYFKGEYSPHVIRHSKAMHLVNNGVPLEVVRAFLGHDDITSTQIYATPDEKTKREQLLKNSKTLNVNDKYTDKQKKELEKLIDKIIKM